MTINEPPEEVHFDCPRCKRDCVMHPRAKPINVQHSRPVCEEWLQVTMAKKKSLEQFLIEAGVHLHVPGSLKSN